MDELSRALDGDMLKHLECPVCMEYMVPPIKLCRNGHTICSTCKGRFERCPTCRAEFSEIRCLVLEDIARSQKHPCVNRQSGCLELFSFEHIAEHRAVCAYGNIKCPFHLKYTCSWIGFKNDLIEHAFAAHPASVVWGPKFRSITLSDGVAVVKCFSELFTYRKQKKDGRYNCAVQLIGTSNEASKYKCEFTLRAANGIEQISKTFLVHGYSEDFEAIINSRKCLSLDEETINLFVVDEQLNLTVALSTV